MDYYFSLKDSSGYVHSIDNLVLNYYIEGIGTKCIDKMISDLQCIKNKYNNLHYWENFNINPCSKYSFYRHEIHMDDGLTILLGHYTDYDRDTKNFTLFPMIQFKFNPNKHGNKPVLKDVMELINSTCYDCTLNKYDYAVDIPLSPDKVHVFGSNKEKGLFKGTRYYGQRNRNGFCRIYDKQKEQGLESPLTRIEHVFSTVKTTKKLSFEKVYVQDDVEDLGTLSKTDAVIVELCTTLKANHLDFEEIINKLDRRKKKTIMSHLNGNGYKLLEFDKCLHDNLLKQVIKEFGIKELTEKEEFIKNEIVTDADGFIDMNENDFEVPFD